MAAVRSRRDVEARAADLSSLGSAHEAGELHRALVLGPPAAYEREPTMPLHYFTRVHEHNPEGAATTAVLLVTDPRWVPASQPLMRAVADTGILSEQDLDLLAQTFVAAGPNVYWECPSDWFSGPEIVIAGEDKVVHDSDEDTAGGAEIDDDDDGRTVVARAVPAGARRWAAALLVRRAPASWGQLLVRARSLGGPDGGAILRGVLDAIDDLPVAAARLIRDEALQSSRHDVRLPAIQLLAEEDLEAARERAATDPSQKVRQWGTRLQPRNDEHDPDCEHRVHAKVAPASEHAGLQVPLFQLTSRPALATAHPHRSRAGGEIVSRRRRCRCARSPVDEVPRHSVDARRLPLQRAVEEGVQLVGDVLVVEGDGLRVVAKRRRRVAVTEASFGLEDLAFVDEEGGDAVA